MRHRLVVAASLLEKEADVLLPHDADVEYHGCLQEIGDDVNVEEKVGFEPREDEEDPCDAHGDEH